MKTKFASVVVSLSVALVLAGCNRSAPPADGLPSTAATTDATAPAMPASVAAPAPATVSDVSFSVEPGTVYNCEGRDRTISTVKWNVTRPGVNEIKVQVMGPGDTQKKTLAVMRPVGEAATGNWVAKDVKFDLVNSETGEELATYTVNSLPCE